VKVGDLIKTKRGNRLGIIIEVFSDLDLENPWIKVHWTHPKEAYEWCNRVGLLVVDAAVESK